MRALQGRASAGATSSSASRLSSRVGGVLCALRCIVCRRQCTMVHISNYMQRKLTMLSPRPIPLTSRPATKQPHAPRHAFAPAQPRQQLGLRQSQQCAAAAEEAAGSNGAPNAPADNVDFEELSDIIRHVSLFVCSDGGIPWPRLLHCQHVYMNMRKGAWGGKD
eukprot:1156735-Pelagomonas_calceolata.AAC.5